MVQTVGYLILVFLFVISVLVAVPITRHGLDVGVENFTQSKEEREVLQRPIKLLIDTSKVCSSTTRILIVVHSAVGNFGRRQTIRATYGQQKWRHKFRFNVLFAVGTLEDKQNLFGKWLLEESEEFQDIIQGDFLDDYNNLTTKVLMWLRYVENNCLQTTHLIHLDDDIAIDLFSIMHAYYTEKMFQDNTVYCMAEAYLESELVRDKENKWFVPKSTYPEAYYPIYCAGAAYIFPTNVVKMVIDNMQTRKYIQVDDAVVTGIVREAVNVDILKIEPRALLRADPDRVVLTFLEKKIIIAECSSDHCFTRVWDHVVSEYETAPAPRIKLKLKKVTRRIPLWFTFLCDFMFVISFLFILSITMKIVRRKRDQSPIFEHKVNLL